MVISKVFYAILYGFFINFIIYDVIWNFSSNYNFGKPLIGEPIISIIMVTIGLSIFQAIMNWMFGVFTEPFPQIFSSESLNIFGLNVQTVYLMSGLISIFIMISFALFLKNLGRV